ncbi:MAG: lysine transporter LysE [Candidatus Chloroheliales bacterium]|nr:MAG: lysine transporter LysE [Chloroflexota bacterium]
MDPSFFLKGVALGFAVAAPVGPIGVLCIRRTLANGRLTGFVTGLGTATADMLYASVAGFGLTSVAALLTGMRFWLGLLGGLFLCYLGVTTLLSNPSPQDPLATSGRKGSDPLSPPGERVRGRLLGAYLSSFLLTITNPLTILSFAAVFAVFGVASSSRDYATATLLVLGVFAGSASWWFILSGATSLLRARLDARWLLWVNRVSGMIFLVAGVVALWSLI